MDPPHPAETWGAPYLGRSKELQNSTPCPEAAWQSAMMVGWPQQFGMASAPESQSQILGMPRSHW